jgi:hypothetical protein
MARESPKYSCATRPVPEPECYLCYSARPEPEYYLCYPARGPGPAPCRPLPAATTISYSAFCIYGSYMIPSLNGDYFLNSINQLIFVMVKCCVLLEVRTECLNIIKTRVGFKG